MVEERQKIANQERTTIGKEVMGLLRNHIGRHVDVSYVTGRYYLTSKSVSRRISLGILTEVKPFYFVKMEADYSTWARSEFKRDIPFLGLHTAIVNITARGNMLYSNALAESEYGFRGKSILAAIRRTSFGKEGALAEKGTSVVESTARKAGITN